ncbi:MAG: ligand-binding sensor domain-containing diguanylate cyclase [Janthinobacterium lividum]
MKQLTLLLRSHLRPLVLWLSVLALAAVASAQHFSTKTFDESSGLANLNVHGFVQDSQDRVWIGTENGVFLANGNIFEKQAAFEKASIESVRVLRGDAADRIWVLESRQLSVFAKGQITTVPGLDLRLMSTSNDDLIALPGDTSGIYLLHDGVLERVELAGDGTWRATPAFSPALLQQHPVLQHLSRVVSAGQHALWASAGHILLKIDLARKTVAPIAEQQTPLQKDWTALYGAHNGTLWVRNNATVAFVDGRGQLQPVQHPGTQPMETKEPQMQEDAEGRILVNLSQGMGRISGRTWEAWSAENGLPSQEIDSFLCLHSGDVWLGPSGHGVARWLGYGQWEAWTEAEGMRSSVIWPIQADLQRTLWIAGESAVDRLDLRERKVLPILRQLPRRRASALIVDGRQHVWIGYSDGNLYEVDPAQHVRLVASGLGRVLKLMQDRGGTVWVCSESGLHRLTPGDDWKTARLVGTDEMPAGYAWYITQAKDGTIWLSSESGLHRLRNGAWKAVAVPWPPGRPHNFMLAVALDGTLWVQGGGEAPLLHLKVQGEQTTVLPQANPYPGSNNITFVDIDTQGLLWVGSDAGVSVFNGRHWIQCTREDGLVWNDTDFHAFFADTDGSAWIGTSAGLAHLLHPDRLFSAGLPVARVQAATVAGVALTEGATHSFDLRRPTLNVKMLDTNYNRGSSLVYRFHLDGLEDGWQTEQNTIEYPALAPGSYRLFVVAYDGRQNQQSEPLILAFRVLAPWWQRPWCAGLELLGVLLLLLLCWRASVRMLVRRQQQLEAMVEQRTRELVQEKNELDLARGELIQAARTDALTGLLTRPAIFQEMQRLFDMSMRGGKHFAYAMADLDCFKNINDSFGHVAGDQVLRTCAARVMAMLRTGELAGRYGGEELLILLPGLTRTEAMERLEAIRMAIAAEPVVHGSATLTVTCSFGLAFSPRTSSTTEVLIQDADKALYRAKQNGRNGVECSERMHAIEPQADYPSQPMMC